MANHKKPTKAELDEDIKKGLEELDTPEDEPTPAPSEPAPSEPAPSEAAPSEPAPSEPAPSEPAPSEPAPSEPAPSEPEPSPDYKQKYVDSAREAQILHAKNKKISEALEKANQLETVTDEELEAEYGDVDLMDDTTKKLAKDNLLNKKRLSILDDVTKESKNIEDWNIKVDTFINDPKTLSDNPELEGRAEDFKIFATKKSRRGVDFETLVGSFLYDVTKHAAPRKKGQMFERGSGGPPIKPKLPDGKISVGEARLLMKRDYKKYKQMLKDGKIATENIE